jgi:DnaA family protein
MMPMQQLLLELSPLPAPSFGSFYPGRNAAALAALAEAIAGGERLVCLWGEPGSGKSHLLRAFVNEAVARGLAARYVAAPHVQLAEPEGEREALAVDDVERLNDAGQLALFDRFNALKAGGGRLITTAPCPPAELTLREDLRTRLGAGLVLRLLPLDDAEKTAALAWHAASRGIRLAPEIAAYLHNHCERDMGTQMAVLDALDRHSLEQRRPITLPLLRDALKTLFGADARN